MPVRRSADQDATPADINRCETYLTSVLEKFPKEYSSAVVTDAQGVTRCASLPTAVGVNFSDREIFRLVRDTKAFALGAPGREPGGAAHGDTGGASRSCRTARSAACAPSEFPSRLSAIS